MVEPHISNFRGITTKFLGVRMLRKFTVHGKKGYGTPLFSWHHVYVNLFSTANWRRFPTQQTRDAVVWVCVFGGTRVLSPYLWQRDLPTLPEASLPVMTLAFLGQGQRHSLSPVELTWWDYEVPRRFCCWTALLRTFSEIWKWDELQHALAYKIVHTPDKDSDQRRLVLYG